MKNINLKVEYSINHSIQHIDTDQFDPEPVHLNKAKNIVRETLQDKPSDRAQDFISKLRQNEDISKQELKIIENWIIGDAENYTKIEQHFTNWIQELNNLLSEIQHFTFVDEQLGETDLLRLEGLLVNIDYTLKDIMRYKTALDRIRRFKSYVGEQGENLTNQRKQKVADLIKTMLYPPYY